MGSSNSKQTDPVSSVTKRSCSINSIYDATFWAVFVLALLVAACVLFGLYNKRGYRKLSSGYSELDSDMERFTGRAEKGMEERSLNVCC